jgi:hypothetical protein
MILIFSKSANVSPQIKREVERAVNKGVYIIPFRVDDILPARSLEYFISTSQWMDAFSPPLERHLDNSGEDGQGGDKEFACYRRKRLGSTGETTDSRAANPSCLLA